MLKFFERPRQVALQLNTRIDAKLDAVAALPPPPIAISIQRAFAVSIPMQTASVASLGMHLFVTLGVGFTVFDEKKFAPPHNVMEVVLVNSKSANRPHGESLHSCIRALQAGQQCSGVLRTCVFLHEHVPL